MLELAGMFPDEEVAREWSEAVIWPDGERGGRTRYLRGQEPEVVLTAAEVAGATVSATPKIRWVFRAGRPPASRKCRCHTAVASSALRSGC